MRSNYTTTQYETIEDRTNALIKYFSPPLGEQNLKEIQNRIKQCLEPLGFYDGVIPDIVNETLFVLFSRGIESFKNQMFINGTPSKHFYSFLIGIARNVANKYRRGYYAEIKKRTPNYLRENNNKKTDPFMALVHTEQKEGLEQAIDELPKNQRIVTRIYLEEGNNIDTAKRLNKTLASTRMVLIRSRRNMQKIFRNKRLTESYFFEGK